MKLRKFLSLISLFAILASVVLADTIRLKDGSTIKGRITGFSGGKFTIAIGEGSRRREFSFSASEIESIEFDRSEPAERLAENRTVSITKKPVEDQPVKSKVEDEPVVVEDEPVKVAEQPAKKEPPQTSPDVKPISVPAAIKPIVLNVSVLADSTANGWTNSGWVVKRGQKIRIVGDGEVSLGGGKKTGASGLYDLEDETKLLKSVPTGALIAVIGDDNNDFIYIGADREFVATRDGTLFLGLNEGNLKDNTGSFKVRIEISPQS